MIHWPPANPDLKRELKARLLSMTPRAFELFAGDLLIYVGLQNIVVTRYVGDGGIDAHGDLIGQSNVVRIPIGVQVKRHRNNVQRSDIDRFIGALSGQFLHGIFITTASYAAQARIKASSSPFVNVSTVDGEQVVSLMEKHDLGLVAQGGRSPQIDESYFVEFEERTALVGAWSRESRENYHISRDETDTVNIQPEIDLISLRTLSYALRVDVTTIRRNWIEKGKLQPDATQTVGSRELYYFRRDRIEQIRKQLVRSSSPTTSEEWRQEFLDFVKNRNLTKSYKPVMLKIILKLVDRNGEVRMEDLVREFKDFYVQRHHNGLPVEFNVPLLLNPLLASDTQIRQLIVKNPLDRFLIKGFLEYAAEEGRVRFAPQLWGELRYYELIDIQQSVDEQIHYYYNREALST
jgi:Restriction endonuclease